MGRNPQHNQHHRLPLSKCFRSALGIGIVLSTKHAVDCLLRCGGQHGTPDAAFIALWASFIRLCETFEVKASLVAFTALVVRVNQGGIYLRLPRWGYREWIWDHLAGAVVISVRRLKLDIRSRLWGWSGGKFVRVSSGWPVVSSFDLASQYRLMLFLNLRSHWSRPALALSMACIRQPEGVTRVRNVGFNATA